MLRERALRSGHSLVEVLVALPVLAIAAAATITMLIVVTRVGRVVGNRTESLAALRALETIAAWETRRLSARAADLSVSTDSIALRAFRGYGIACASGPPAMRYRGLRAPDATKDSIVVISRASAFIMDPVAFTATSVCPAGPGEQVWQLDATGVQPGDVVLVFERGVYHLSAAALRYRRGAGGRQPVTADVFDDDSTDVALEMIGRTPPAPTEPVAISLRSAIRSAGPAIRVRRSRIALLNTLLPLDSMEP